MNAMFIVVRCYQTGTPGSLSINDVVSVEHGRVMETVSRRFDRDTNLSFQRQDADQAAPSSFTAPILPPGDNPSSFQTAPRG